MMFEAGAIAGRMSFDKTEPLRAMKDIPAAAAKMKQELEPAMDNAGKGGAKAFLSGMKGELGKGSVLGQFTKLAMGGGAIAGVTMLGRELASVSKSMEEASIALRNGKMSTGAFAEQTMASLPVLGEFWQVGRSIQEMFTGEAAAAQRAAEAQAHLNTQIEREIALQKARKAETANLAQSNAAAAANELKKTSPELGATFDYQAAVQKAKAASPSIQPLLAQNKGDVDATKAFIQSQIAELQKQAHDKLDDFNNAQQKLQMADKAANPFLNEHGIKTGNQEKYNQELGVASGELRLANEKLQSMMRAIPEVTQYAKAIKDADAQKAQAASTTAGPPNSEGPQANVSPVKKQAVKTIDEMQTALVDALKTAHDQVKEFRQMPRAGVAASDVTGSHMVTSADLPPAYQETQASIKKTAENTERVAKATEAMRDALKQGPTAGGAALGGVDIVTSGSW